MAKSSVRLTGVDRGYPNLDSLKDLSRLFGISIDELLSNNELFELAKTENRANIGKMSGLVFAMVDMLVLAFFFMPLFGRQAGGQVQNVTLFAYAGSGFLRAAYAAVLAAIAGFGLLQLVFLSAGCEKGLRMGKPCSVALHAAGILLFALSRQPYVTSFLFLLFMVKMVLLLRENGTGGGRPQ